MKVDLVVNSMIQQIDRNMLAQAVSLVAFRTGEILRGRVMLDAGDKPQIRLDSGELLSALPSGDVQLFAGATVTLRVTGSMDGRYVMQLLEQEIDGRASAGQAQEGAGEALTRLGLGGTAQGKAVIAAMDAMRVPPREDTARQAMTILGARPDLTPEKAVFLAANGIAPTDAAVAALNALVERGATTGAELTKFAELLTAQALEAENAAAAGGLPAGAAEAPAHGVAAQPQGPTAEALSQPAQTQGQPQQAQSQPVQAQSQPQQAQGPAAQTAVPAPGEQSVPQGSGPGPMAAPGQDAAAQASPPIGEAMLELQSLIYVGLGPEAVERYSGIMSALQRQGMAGEAGKLALDGSLAGGAEFEAALAAFAAALPEGEAGEARAFVARLADGLKSHADTQAAAAGASGDAPQGLQRVVKEVMDLFVKLDAEAASNAQELRQSSKSVRDTVQRLSAELRDAGAASPDAARQLTRVENHVRLLDNINQYVYQQIPVEMNGRNRSVELYVMNRNGGGKKINPEKASILIALDTENMGRLETMISVNGKSLRLRFGVENPSLAGYVNSYTGDLGRAMQEIGFKLSEVRAQVTGRPVTPLIAIGEAESWQESSMRLDIKL